MFGKCVGNHLSSVNEDSEKVGLSLYFRYFKSKAIALDFSVFLSKRPFSLHLFRRDSIKEFNTHIKVNTASKLIFISWFETKPKPKKKKKQIERKKER